MIRGVFNSLNETFNTGKHASNNPAELMIIIPILTAGTYSLEVTSQFGSTALLKETCTSIFDKVLSVQ